MGEKHIVFLSENMKFSINHIERVGSTNNYAFDLCKQRKAKEGDVFVANEQYCGRGYHGNNWLSEPGKNLTISLVLQPGFILPGQQFALTQCISIAITDLLNDLLPNQTIRIKWPNDIYINDNKVCGILVQNTIIGNMFEYAIIGIGLNVNQIDFPDELLNPVSIIHYLKSELELDSVLKDLLKSVKKRYRQLMITTRIFNEAYLKQLYRFEEVAVFKDENATFKGRIKGIGEFGELQVEDETGRLRVFNFKEVEMVI